MLLAYCINIAPAAAAPTGSGTELDPFLITSENDLRLITGASDACWRFENDIALTQNFSLAEFSGTLDGNGHKISNISLSSSEGYSENEAAFILENTGTIKNLHVEGTANYDSSNPGGSIFVYENSGTIEGCSVKGRMNVTLLNTHSQNGSNAGAFTAHNQAGGVIRNCYSRVYMHLTVSGGSTSKIAGTSGFVNENNGYIENCYAATYGRTSSIPYSGFRTNSDDGTFSSCYYDNDLPGINERDTDSFYNVFPLTTEAMKWSGSYSGWDFGGTWAIDENINDGYPYLQNEKSLNITVTGLKLDRTEASLPSGSQLTLTPIFTPENASDQSVSWSTSSRYVATVTDGVVTAVAPGTAVITAATNDGIYSDSCTVTVYEPEPLDYAVNSLTVTEGSGKLRAEVSVTKNSDTKDGVVIIGLYDSTGALSDYIFIDGDLDQGKTYTLGGTLPSVPGGTVKAFVWDSLDSMQPISNSAERKL